MKKGERFVFQSCGFNMDFTVVCKERPHQSTYDMHAASMDTQLHAFRYSEHQVSDMLLCSLYLVGHAVRYPPTFAL